VVDADGQRWTVLEVQRAALQTCWQCMTRNLAIAYGLDDTVTILKAVYAKGTGGAAEATWQVWKTGIRARIQPAALDVGTRHQARHTAARFQIFLEEDVPLNHNHRIRGPDATIYRIHGTNASQRIGELQQVDATRLSDGQ
jgi:hypothetical protein